MAGAGHWAAVRVWSAAVFGLRSIAERLCWWCGAGFGVLQRHLELGFGVLGEAQTPALVSQSKGEARIRFSAGHSAAPPPKHHSLARSSAENPGSRSWIFPPTWNLSLE